MSKVPAGELPSLTQLKTELAREKYRTRFIRILWSTIFTLVVVAAATVLVAVLWLPVLEIYGTSMSPTLEEGEIVVSLKAGKPEMGDIVAFYYGNKLLVKRVVGMPGDMVMMDEDGNVSVNGVPLEETYLVEKAYGDCDVAFPFEVPIETYFVMGDRRSTSLDSRNSAVGCVREDQIVGKVVMRVWPLPKIGMIRNE